MNNLFSHIEYLLLSHDCVIVPGLGAFIAIVNHATIDYGKGIIAPPSRSVMFNQAISSDDGLLANSYVRKYNLSFEEARQIIIRETNLLKSTLSYNKEFQAGNLGTLRLGEEGNLVFTPTASVGEFNSSLGFKTVDLFGSLQNTHAAEPTSCEAQSVSAEESVANKSTYYNLRIRKTLPKVAASLFFIVAFAVAVILYPIPSDNREQRASVVPVEAIMTPKIQTIPLVDASIKQDIKKEEKEETENPLPTHYLIIATFSSNSEALKYIAGHSSEELPMEAVESKKVTRVAIASSDNKDVLRKTLNSKDILGKYPNAWIWSRQ